MFTVDNGSLPNHPIKVNDDCELSMVDFSPLTAYNSLLRLKTKCSFGPADGVPNTFLKNVASVVCEPLSFIFDSSFRCGVLPSSWLHAIVTPVFKKGVTSDPGNNRPIFMTCVCCRLMESIINNSFVHYLHNNELINDSQHGFLRKRSTCTNLLDSIHDWAVALNRKHSVDVIYIDFRKAFDTVSHPKLISKLESYGFSGFFIALVKSVFIEP